MAKDSARVRSRLVVGEGGVDGACGGRARNPVGLYLGNLLAVSHATFHFYMIVLRMFGLVSIYSNWKSH